MSNTVAILAVQGAFIEHRHMVEQLGARVVELRQASDLKQHFDRLILPGGESTVQSKLLRELGMMESLRQHILEGMPVLGTCAGMILLAQRVEGNEVQGLQTMDISVRRNAYGRQLGSFHTTNTFETLGVIPMTFIRAPYIVSVGDQVQTLATVDGNIVAARHHNQIATSFHPELDSDTRIHELFLSL